MPSLEKQDAVSHELVGMMIEKVNFLNDRTMRIVSDDPKRPVVEIGIDSQLRLTVTSVMERQETTTVEDRRSIL